VPSAPLGLKRGPQGKTVASMPTLILKRMKMTERTPNVLSKAAAIVVLVAGFLFAVGLQLGTNTDFIVRSRYERRLAHEEVSGGLKPAPEPKVRQ